MISLPPTKDEISFCNEALGGAGLPYFMKARSASAASMDMNPKSSLVERNFNEPSIDEANNMENESADDDGSWETVDSADDTQEQDNVEADGTLTSNIIYKYFKSNAYDT